MKTMTTLGALLTMTTLALAGCQAPEDIDRESTEQELGAAAKVEDQARPFRHGPRDPAKMFALADKNGDGALVETEVEARHWAFLKIADVDGDSRLSKAELEAAHTAGKLRPPHGEHFGHKPPTAEGLIERFDVNKDGKLELSEMPERMRERIQGSDADSNGVLERTELDAHFAEMKARFESHQRD